MQQHPDQPSQISPEYLIESLKQQRNEYADALAIMHARYAHAADSNKRLIEFLGDPSFLKARLEELESASGETEEPLPDAETPPVKAPSKKSK